MEPGFQERRVTGERLAVIETEMHSLKDRMSEHGTTLSTVADDVTAIKLALERSAGASLLAHNIIQACVGLGGVVAGVLGIKTFHS